MNDARSECLLTFVNFACAFSRYRPAALRVSHCSLIPDFIRFIDINILFKPHFCDSSFKNTVLINAPQKLANYAWISAKRQGSLPSLIDVLFIVNQFSLIIKN
uniref:Uncharacterized protein n=1 Tax=Vibrio parahaemolyticus TaxID=670 RepID=A0A5P4S667_VIBPH|nr:hypothetical protein [Vibrio parahaemolyticus]